ncbi:MAG: ParA family protein [Phycisphaeraceae bacterium]|nr:ParA family protein [Phycisphaeraceae bacterium]
MKIISVANQKGGCGKTTTSVNLSAAMAVGGARVLLVDMDPQGHATLGIGHDPDKLDRTIANALADSNVSINDVTLETSLPGLSLAPSNIMLGAVEIDLRDRTDKELALREKLNEVSNQYDYCIIDCAPPLSLLMLNALVASSSVVVTVQTQYYAVEGLKRLLETIHIVRKRFHICDVKALGLLLTFVESRTVLCREIQKQLRDFFGQLVFESVIHRNVLLAEAPSAGESILTYAPKNKASKEYMALSQEVIKRLDLEGTSVSTTQNHPPRSQTQEDSAAAVEDSSVTCGA